MLMPSPTVLRGLVEEYEALLAEETLAGAAEPSPRLRDLGYTLCVSTGTREIRDALAAARAHLVTTASAPATPAPHRSGAATPRFIAPRPAGSPATPAAGAPLAADTAVP